MSSEKVKVVIPPEKMAGIKEKFGLTDDDLQGILEGIHVVPVEGQAEQPQAGVTRTTQEEEETMPQLFRKISSGEFTMVDYLMWSDMQDRREERKRRHEREDQPPKTATAKEVGDEVVRGLKEAGVLPAKPKTEEEMPGWAKKMQDDQAQILGRLTKDDEEKRLKETVSAAVKPLEDKLSKTEEELKRTKEEIKPKEKPKGELETTKDTLKTLSEIDELRGKGERLPEGTPGEVTLATKTIDKGEKIVTKGMDDMKDTLETVLEYQLTREKRQFQAQAPKLPKLTDQEKLETLQKAAGEPPQPATSKGGG